MKLDKYLLQEAIKEAFYRTEKGKNEKKSVILHSVKVLRQLFVEGLTDEEIANLLFILSNLNLNEED